MGLTSSVKQWYIKSFQGMNSKYEENELDIETGIIAQNCRFEDEPGSVKKRDDISYYNADNMGAGTSTKSIYRYYKSDASTILLASHGTSMYVGNDVSGAMTAIRTGLTTGKRFSYITYKDLCIMSNGYDDIFVFDGESDNVTWELGSCKALVGSSTGITRTAISYQITLDADAYICGAVSNTIAAVTDEDIELSNIPLGPVGTTNRKIYRKSSETGGGYKLIDTIADNTTTTYTDTTADASGNAAIPAVTDDMPKGSALKLHRERLFITVDPNNPNRIYYSNPYFPHYIQQTTNTDYMDVGKDDNDEIMGIPIQQGLMCCIKKNNIRKLHITTATSGADPALWYADDPIVFSGTPAQWSIVQTKYGIIYLGWDHWYVFNGANSVPLIDEFDTSDILSSSYSDTVTHINNDILHASYTDSIDGNTYHDRIMLYNFKRKALSFDRICADCFTSFTGDDESGDLYYGCSTDGWIYRAARSTNTIKWRKKSQLDDVVNRSLIDNGSLEYWTDGTTSAPDDWTLAGAAATIARDSTNKVGFDYGAAITRAGTNCYLKQSISNYEDYQSETVYAGCWIKATVADRARITVDDGVGNTSSSYHTGGGDWEYISISHSVDASASELTLKLEINTGDTVCYFDEPTIIKDTVLEHWSHDIVIGGTEDDPVIKIGRDETINELSGTINNLSGTVDMNDTDGVMVFPAANIRAGTMGKVYWNERLFHASRAGTDSIKVYTRAGSSKANCLAATWSDALTNPNGSTIVTSANDWFQIKVEMTAYSTSGSPEIYYTGGYCIKYNYTVGGTSAESEIEFIYDVGFRNFEKPMVDKIFKKIVTNHCGSAGYLTVGWETENSSGSFTISLSLNSEKWENYFPSSAMGRKIRLRFYKNDLHDFKLKEVQGIYSPEPVLV